MDEFTVSCGRCVKGKVPSPKTGNPINCRTCRGTGERTRRQWSYTADFRIIWDEGHEDIVDVKGWANERFPLVRKMFEYRHEIGRASCREGVWGGVGRGGVRT